jgi:hypothetical protein
VDDYFLGGFDPSLVQPPSHLTVLNATAAKSSSGRLQTLFCLRLPQSPVALSGAATPVIYAVGPLDPAGNLQQHQLSQASYLSFLCGPARDLHYNMQPWLQSAPSS